MVRDPLLVSLAVFGRSLGPGGSAATVAIHDGRGAADHHGLAVHGTPGGPKADLATWLRCDGGAVCPEVQRRVPLGTLCQEWRWKLALR